MPLIVVLIASFLSPVWAVGLALICGTPIKPALGYGMIMFSFSVAVIIFYWVEIEHKSQKKGGRKA